MKRFLLGLSIALAAFFGGIMTTEIFRFGQIPIVAPVLETNESVSFISTFEPSKEDKAIENLPDEPDISGWYALEKYKGMPEVNMILLSNGYENDDPASGKIVSYAGVFTEFENEGDQGFVDSVRANVNERGASFKTNKIKGIEYRFAGVFFKNKTDGEDGEKLLRGTLQKFVKGKKVAEASGDFAYREPHCWH